MFFFFFLLSSTGARVQVVVYVGIHPHSGLRFKPLVLQEHATRVRGPVRDDLRHVQGLECVVCGPGPGGFSFTWDDIDGTGETHNAWNLVGATIEQWQPGASRRK